MSSAVPSTEPNADVPALEIEGLAVRIEQTPVLRHVSLSVPKRGVVGLIGRNGAGKTTLLRAVMGLVPAAEGAIRLDGQALTAVPSHRRARLGVGYMPEDRRLVPELTVEENIFIPAWACRAPEPIERYAWIATLIPEVRSFSTRRALELSGGQQKLVALARALMVSEQLLLLDEPFEGVAPALAARLVEVLSALKDKGLSILLCESDDRHTPGLVDERYTLERGVSTAS